MPAFLAVINTEPDNAQHDRAQRRARAHGAAARRAVLLGRRPPDDARVAHLPRLDTLLFHKNLGSYRDKAERIERAGAAGSPRRSCGAPDAAADRRGRPARLAKADLTTDMVREFTELQGTMGGIYAREEGQPEAVWKAIYYHYLPRRRRSRRAAVARRSSARPRSRGRPSRSPTSSTRSSGCSRRASGRPARAIRSASGARRRALLRILVDLPELTGLEMPVAFDRMLEQARQGVGEVHGVTDAPEAWRDAVTAFLLDRLRYLFEQRGFAYDELNAVLGRAAGVPDPLDARRRLEALRGVRGVGRLRGAGRGLQAREEHRRASCSGPAVDARRPADGAGRAGACSRSSSAGRRRSGRPRPRAATTRRSRIASGFRPAVDRFFTDVFVMVEDAGAARPSGCRLLRRLHELLLELADISEIVPKVGVITTDGVKVQMAKKTAKIVKPVKPVKAAKPARKPVKKHVAAKAPKAAKKYVYFFGERQGRRQPDDEGPARRQGLRPRRDDQRRPAGAAGLHDLHRGLQPLLRRAGGKLPAGHRRRDDGAPAEAREGWPARSSARPTNPLLVSVRSGAKFSMPGMMDTILNLGLNDADGRGPEGADRATAASPSTATAASSRCSATSCSRSRRTTFEHEFEAVKNAHGAKLDTDLDEDGAARGGRALQEASSRRRRASRSRRIRCEQLQGRARRRVPLVDNPRAIEYRRIYDIPDHIGTAVNVQMMVFGNTGDRSATGVGFTRNPATGAKEFFGEFLINAQGEDVVAGIRTPQPIAELEKVMPKAYKQLRAITTRLEKHYKDIQDFEFTIQDEKLYMLQTRSGKRTGYAAVVIATDLVAEKLITPKEALLLVDPESLVAAARARCSTRRSGRSCRSRPRACRRRRARRPARWSSRPTTRWSGPSRASR